jgi:hypothetical protein
MKLRSIAFTATLILEVSCTEMPVIKLNPPHEQQKLSSASHWRIIAADLSQDIHGMKSAAVDINGVSRCVRIGRPDDSATRFQQFLADSIAEEFVSPEGMRRGGLTFRSPAQDERENADGPVSFDVYRHDAEDAGCDEITIESRVIKHAGPPGRPYPGEFTLLAVGAIVVRNVVNAFSGASVIGAVALGETAFWASSGFRSGDTVTEIAVTVSRLTPNRRYVAQFTNVYYINSGDSGFYETPPPKTRPVVDVSPSPTEQYRDQQHSFDQEQATRLSPARIVVAPRVVSACDSTARLLISGVYLSPNEHDYLFGTIPASSFSGSSRPSSGSTDDVQTAEVVFEKVNVYNKGLDVVTISMMGTNGKAAVAYVSVDAACKSTKLPATPTTTPKPEPGTNSKGPPDVNFAPIKAVNLCTSPVQLYAMESNGALIKQVQTIDGYAAAINQAPGDTRKLITFSNLPVYKTKESLPQGGQWSLKVTLATGNSLDKQVRVECDTLKPAKNPPNRVIH